jgi:hypothetical protein
VKRKTSGRAYQLSAEQSRWSGGGGSHGQTINKTLRAYTWEPFTYVPTLRARLYRISVPALIA